MKDKHTNNQEGPGKLPAELRVNPFAVPENYFVELTQKNLLRQRLNADLKDSFQVPEGYFDQLQDSIMAGIAAEKLRAQVSDTGYRVPENYFETLPAKIKAAAIPSSPVVPVRKLGRPRWVQYAAAACVTLALGISVYFRIASDNSTDNQLNNVSDQDILSYLELYGEPDDVVYFSEFLNDVDERYFGEEVNDQDIEAYLNNTL